MIPITPSGIRNKPYMVKQDSVIELSNGAKMFIPRFYATDYASIPFLIKFFFNNIGTYRDAFIIHDFLYNYGYYITDPRKPKIEAVSRIFADREMAYQMKKLGAEDWRVTIYYLGVRLGGWISFRKM
jgi:hypothetical protein